MTHTPELKPCPFCGGEAKPSGSMSHTHIDCDACNARGPNVFHGGPTNERAVLNRCEAEAADLWNRRAVNSLPALVKALEERNDALDAIYIYANDTLSGRADGGPDDREWQRAAVVEIRNRARVFATVQSAVDARAARASHKTGG